MAPRPGNHRSRPPRRTRHANPLLYAHYDVQPPLADGLWHSPAYEPDRARRPLFGRGAADDAPASLPAMRRSKPGTTASSALPVNVTIFWEGEEEIGCPILGILLQQEREALRRCRRRLRHGQCRRWRAVADGFPRGMACGTVRVRGP